MRSGEQRVIEIRPSPRQALFFKERHKYVAYGGARGGGKSWSVRAKALLMCLRYAGIRICIVRKTYPDLYKNHIEELCDMCFGMARYNGQHRTLTFQNGSKIVFSYCQTVKDLEKFQGIAYDVMFIDEATQFTEEMYSRMTACVRGVNEFPKRIYLTCNPGGAGHQWVKRLFIDRAFRPGENPEDYAFIKAKVTDNYALMEKDPDYIRILEALPPKLRRAWLDGDWNVFEGQFFAEFVDDPDHYGDRVGTHVIEPFEVPKHWRIYRSFDWGFSKPFSCDWWAVDTEGRAYLILQYYGCRESDGVPEANCGLLMPPERVFSEIARIEREHRWLAGKQITGVADPAIWQNSGGPPIIEAADKCGVHFMRGDNKRIPGWMQCHYRLAFDEENKPMVYFFNTCKAALRTLPLLQFDEHICEDLDTEGEDHFADSFRYFCMSRPVPPRESVRARFEGGPADPLSSNVRYKRFTF